MALEINANQISSLVSWFNVFVGYSEINNRIDRVEHKHQTTDFTSPNLNRRFEFHDTYRKVIKLTRIGLKLDVSDVPVNRSLSIVATLQELAKQIPRTSAGHPANAYGARGANRSRSICRAMLSKH
jgi:hypothetical protein